MKSKPQFRALLAGVVVLLMLACSANAAMAELCSLVCLPAPTPTHHACCDHGAASGLSIGSPACSHGAAEEQPLVVALAVTAGPDLSAPSENAAALLPAAFAFLGSAPAPHTAAGFGRRAGSHSPPIQSSALPLRI